MFYIRNLHKIIRQSPMSVLELLLHIFGTWILLVAVHLLALLSREPEGLHEALAYHLNTPSYCEHLLLALLLLLGFSLLLCKCTKDKTS
ncbi:MAG: hypothetical protein IJY12_05530 [Clostridia bacterium]|nr:hypothetical protein [Clostridia bacterium]